MDGTETGWDRPAEPAPRWRALLDRALLGSRTGEQPSMGPDGPPAFGRDRPGEPPSDWPGSRAASINPLPTRPVNPDPRHRSPVDQRPHPSEQRDPEAPAPRPDRRAANPLQRPVNPLDPRRQFRPGEGSPGRADAKAPPHTYFNPTTRSAPASPAVALAPPMPQQVPVARAAPSPAPTRIEWRQAPTEDDDERAVAVLRRPLGRPRVLAFANPKGGVHKTTATVLAAATIGSVRGRGVLAWDDNELRGTLGLRAGSARHARTIRHLVSDLMTIENLHGDDLIHQLDDYLRHASDSSYDVLAGEENPRFAQRLDQRTVGRVMDLLRRTHDVICVDTGNNVESANWQTVLKTADQLVITTVPREDAAFTADWMLDLLVEIGMADLVANAVTLISCPSPGGLPLLEDFSQHFATRTRAVVVVPYDPALEVGSSIEYSELQPATRQAWLRAAAVMIEPFAE